MTAGTFNWNYAILLKEDDDHEYWHDPINETHHCIQKNDDIIRQIALDAEDDFCNFLDHPDYTWISIDLIWKYKMLDEVRYDMPDNVKLEAESVYVSEYCYHMSKVEEAQMQNKMTKEEFIEEVQEFVRCYCNDCCLRCEDKDTVWTFDEEEDDLSWSAEIKVVYSYGDMNEEFWIALGLDPNAGPNTYVLGINMNEDQFLDADGAGLYMVLFYELADRYSSRIGRLCKTAIPVLEMADAWGRR